MQWHLVFSQCRATITANSRAFLPPAQGALHPLTVPPHSPSPQPLSTARPPPLSVDLPLLDVSWKWNRALCGLLCPTNTGKDAPHHKLRGKMQIKTTRRCHLTPTRMAVIREGKITSVGEDVEEPEPGFTAGEGQMVPPLWTATTS